MEYIYSEHEFIKAYKALENRVVCNQQYDFINALVNEIHEDCDLDVVSKVEEKVDKQIRELEEQNEALEEVNEELKEEIEELKECQKNKNG